MNVDIIPINLEDKEVLRNLLEKYEYEFSQYDKSDLNYLGLYGYKYLDSYWNENDRWAFFFKVNDNIAGFALINTEPILQQIPDYVMAEFCVLPKYRRNAVGSAAAKTLFGIFKGDWQIKCHPKNDAAVAFWSKVVSTHTNGEFTHIKSHPEFRYNDGTRPDVFVFKT